MERYFFFLVIARLFLNQSQNAHKKKTRYKKIIIISLSPQRFLLVYGIKRVYHLKGRGRFYPRKRQFGRFWRFLGFKIRFTVFAQFSWDLIFFFSFSFLFYNLHSNVGLISSEIMLKHSLNNSKTTLKKSRKRLF